MPNTQQDLPATGRSDADSSTIPAPQLQRRRLITRRQTSYLLATGAAVSIAGVVRLVNTNRPVSVAEATQFIQQSGDRLIAILNGQSDTVEKHRQLKTLIDESVDVYGIARFALGRYWEAASAEQRDETVRLFPSVLLGSIGRTIGAYQGTKFTVDRSALVNDNVRVWTTVLRPSDAPRQVTWVVGTVGGAIKIVDIMAEGASMRITQRDDCASFLAHNNQSIPALLGALRHQVEVTS